MEYSSDTYAKLNFQKSQHVFEDVIEESRYYLYYVEFFKANLLVAEMQMVFDHLLSREEFVKALKGYDEVRNERYDAVCRKVTPITLGELVHIRKMLVDSRGAYQMTKETILAQDENAKMDGAIRNLLVVDPKIANNPEKKAKVKKALKKGGYL